MIETKSNIFSWFNYLSVIRNQQIDLSISPDIGIPLL